MTVACLSEPFEKNMIISLKPHYSVVPDVKLPEKLTRLKLETVDLSITDSPPAFTTSRPDSPVESKKI